MRVWTNWKSVYGVVGACNHCQSATDRCDKRCDSDNQVDDSSCTAIDLPYIFNIEIDYELPKNMTLTLS